MSASALGNMERGRREMTLLLLLALSACLAGKVLSQTEEDTAEGAEGEIEGEIEDLAADEINTELPADISTTLSPDLWSSVSPSVGDEHGSGEDSGVSIDNDSTSVPPDPEDPDAEGLSTIIILVPVVLVVVIIAVVAGILLKRRLTRKINRPDHGTEDPYLDASGSEKVPMPMFEDDVPSVLELEMEDMEQWMSKDSAVESGPV